VVWENSLYQIETWLSTHLKRTQIIGTTIEVRELRQKNGLESQILRLRANERGHLEAKFARLRVWLVYNNEPREEWLLMRQDPVHICQPSAHRGKSSTLTTE